MRNKIISFALALFILLSGKLSAQQPDELRWGLELGVGMIKSKTLKFSDFPMGLHVEGRLYWKSLDFGIKLELNSIPQRTEELKDITINGKQLIIDYNLRPTEDLCPFLGLGFGAMGDIGFVEPRIGLEIFENTRLTFGYRLANEFNFMKITFGFIIGR